MDRYADLRYLRSQKLIPKPIKEVYKMIKRTSGVSRTVLYLGHRK